MFSSQEYLDNKTGRDDLNRFQYLQALVTEFQDTSTRVHSVNVLWNIFGVRFGLLAHNPVEFGAQVLNFGSWRMIIACSIPRRIN